MALLLLVTFWLGSSIWQLGTKAHVAISEAKQTKAEYLALEERKARLEANLAALATERGRDGAIRTAFGVARPGEEVIVLVPPLQATTTPKLKWWQKVLDWF